MREKGSAIPLWFVTVLLCMIVPLSSGCMPTATLLFRDMPDRAYCEAGYRFGYVYAGTRLHLVALRDDGLHPFVWDLPLSLAGDTLLLPVTLPQEWQYYPKCRKWRQDAGRIGSRSETGRESSD